MRSDRNWRRIRAGRNLLCLAIPHTCRARDCTRDCDTETILHKSTPHVRAGSGRLDNLQGTRAQEGSEASWSSLRYRVLKAFIELLTSSHLPPESIDSKV